MAQSVVKDPTLFEALQHVVDASQQLVVDRIALLRIEAREDLYGAVRGIGFIAAAAVLLFYGWLIVMALVVYALAAPLSLGVSIALVACVHVVGGVAAGWIGASALARIKPLRPDDEMARRREERALGGSKGAP